MYGVTKITSEQDVMLITFTGVKSTTTAPAMVLNTFAEQGIVVDMISQTAPRANIMDFNFTVSNSYFDLVMKIIGKIKFSETTNTPLISAGYVKINLYGEDMVTSCGVGAKALTALAENDISTTLITTSTMDISILITAVDEDIALECLNKKFSI